MQHKTNCMQLKAPHKPTHIVLTWLHVLQGSQPPKHKVLACCMILQAPQTQTHKVLACLYICYSRNHTLQYMKCWLVNLWLLQAPHTPTHKVLASLHVTQGTTHTNTQSASFFACYSRDHTHQHTKYQLLCVLLKGPHTPTHKALVSLHVTPGTTHHNT